MALSIPAGYLTRPSAERKYNRSAKSLERDLERARTSNDDEMLAAFKLCTNDGLVREAKDVTTELVNTLTKEGKNPTWVVSEKWLEQTYGKKGDPIPQKQREVPLRSGQKVESRSPNDTNDDATYEKGSDPIATNVNALPNDVQYLKERIRILELEKQDEIVRNEKREEKLFAQLDVKDRQIAAWDKISQGITRGLATGKIKPSDDAPKHIEWPEDNESKESEVVEAQVVESEQAKPTQAPKSKPSVKAKVKAKPKTRATKKSSGTKKTQKKESTWFKKNLPSLFTRK